MPPGGDTERELRQVAESLVLADRMFRKGKIAEAEPMYERSLAMLIRTYAEAHPDVDACLLRLGDIYFAREKFAQALSTYSRLHGLRSRTLSIHHIDTLAISFKIAKCQERLERLDEAAKTYQEAIVLGEQWAQPGHPLVGSMMESYAILLRKGLNDLQRAAEVEQRAKEFRKQYTGPRGAANKIHSAPSSQGLPFAPADSGLSMSPARAQASSPTPASGPVPAPTLVPTPAPASAPIMTPGPSTTPTPAPFTTPGPYTTPTPAPFTTPGPYTIPASTAASTPLPAPFIVPAAASTQRSTPSGPIQESILPDHISDERDLDADEDDDYDDDDEDQPAPKNFLMIAFIVFVALIVPTFIGWIVMNQHPKFAISQPARQPASLGATTMPITNSETTSQEPASAPIERRAEPVFDAGGPR